MASIGALKNIESPAIVNPAIKSIEIALSIFPIKKPTTRQSLSAHMRVSPHSAISDPDDGVFMLIASGVTMLV